MQSYRAPRTWAGASIAQFLQSHFHRKSRFFPAIFRLGLQLCLGCRMILKRFKFCTTLARPSLSRVRLDDFHDLTLRSSETDWRHLLVMGFSFVVSYWSWASSPTLLQIRRLNFCYFQIMIADPSLLTSDQKFDPSCCSTSHQTRISDPVVAKLHFCLVQHWSYQWSRVFCEVAPSWLPGYHCCCYCSTFSGLRSVLHLKAFATIVDRQGATIFESTFSTRDLSVQNFALFPLTQVFWQNLSLVFVSYLHLLGYYWRRHDRWSAFQARRYAYCSYYFFVLALANY